MRNTGTLNVAAPTDRDVALTPEGSKAGERSQGVGTETRRRRRILRRIGVVLVGLLAIVILSSVADFVLQNQIKGVAMDPVQKNVASKDGTIIAFEQTGTGPVVILVAAALADRGGTTRLAKHLAEHFTVINYDRRGRGKSTDTQPYAVGREVEDIEALIDASGGSAFVFGSSSGSVLALEAASKLGPKVKKLFMYEPPFIIDDSHPPMADDFIKQVTELVSAGRRNDAVKLFFAKGMGIPSIAVTLMRLLMPGWSKMAGMAHTLPYDLTILAGTQAGKPLPSKRWAATAAPTQVVVGGKSEPFFHNGARALVEILPNAQYRSLEGRDHSAILMAPKALAAAAKQFFKTEND
ncbi:MAG TPA: alpha/beta fold hydrolase [Terriglobales bacterium]|nr:alpha/beta fold hydrolase [Terriglobales bacterium]